MSDVSYYFDRIAGEFNGYYTGKRTSFIQEIGYRIFRGPGLKRRFTDTARIIGDPKGAEILDAGCGPCVYAQYFANNGAKVTAIDISQNMLDIGRKNLEESGVKGVVFIRGDFLNYNFASTFDYILAIGFFDYVSRPDIDRYFGKLKQLARKKIIATFPKKFTFQAPIRQALFMIKQQPVYFYTKGMIKDAAERQGLAADFYNSGPIWTVAFAKK